MRPLVVIKQMHTAQRKDIGSHWTSQEILCLFWNPKVHHHAHNSPLLVPIPEQSTTLTSHFSNIHLNIILKKHVILLNSYSSYNLTPMIPPQILPESRVFSTSRKLTEDILINSCFVHSLKRCLRIYNSVLREEESRRCSKTLNVFSISLEIVEFDVTVHAWHWF